MQPVAAFPKIFGYTSRGIGNSYQPYVSYPRVYEKVKASKAETSLMEPKTCQTRLSPHVVDRSYFPLGNYPNCCAVVLIHHLNCESIVKSQSPPLTIEISKPKS